MSQYKDILEKMKVKNSFLDDTMTSEVTTQSILAVSRSST